MVTVVSRSIFGVCLLAVALTAFGASDGWAQGNPNPGVAPPGSTPHGVSYPEWGGKWWAWASSIPMDENPNPAGRFFDVGQSGWVFFLLGYLGRTDVCTVT